jgi:preprotein translocase subunit SecB
MPDQTEATQTNSTIETQLELQRIGARVGGAIALQQIVLRELHWEVPDVNVPPGLPINLAPQFELMIAKAPDGPIFRIRSTVPGTISDQAEISDETDIFRFHCVHQLTFANPAGIEFPDDELRAFGSTSCLLMAYPYVREALASTAAKSGMGPVLLPPFLLAYE